MTNPTGDQTSSTSWIAGVTVLIACIVLSFAAGFFVIWEASNAILIMMVGILFAAIFDAGARGIGLIVSWPRRLRLVIVFLLATLFIAAIFWWGGTTVAEQAGQFIAAMKELPAKLRELFSHGGFKFLNDSVELSQLLPSGSVLFGGATTAISSIIGAVATAVAILFIGAFFAWEPRIYKAAVLSMLPQGKRARVDEVLDKSAYAMRAWMLGQSVSMMVIFLFSLAALMIIKMPYPVLLALQAGLLTFIPTVGPFVAGVLIILAGFSQSPFMALYGFGTYVMIQFLESNLVTPMVQKRVVRIPPGIGLGLQLIAGSLFGVLGLAFAIPIAAAAKVLIEELYVIDRLGGPWKV